MGGEIDYPSKWNKLFNGPLTLREWESVRWYAGANELPPMLRSSPPPRSQRRRSTYWYQIPLLAPPVGLSSTPLPLPLHPRSALPANSFPSRPSRQLRLGNGDSICP